MAWIAATVLALAACSGLVWAWARYVEPRLFAPRTPAPRRPAATQRPPSVLPPGEDGHLAFAETLVTAAEMYREECIERTERRPLPAGDVIDVTSR